MTTEQMGLINEQLRFAGFNEHTDEELSRFEDLPEFELEQTTRKEGFSIFNGQAITASEPGYKNLLLNNSPPN